jgi:hypothetical protein
MAKQRSKAQKPKRKMGRPSEYRSEFCTMLIQHMADGLSFEAFAGVVHKSKDTLYQWVKKHPEFADAKKKGDAESLLFWEKMGITGMVGKLKGFNVAAWIFNMKNRHGYRDRAPDDKPVEADATLLDAMAELDREKSPAGSLPVSGSATSSDVEEP